MLLSFAGDLRLDPRDLALKHLRRGTPAQAISSLPHQTGMTQYETASRSGKEFLSFEGQLEGFQGAK